MQENITDIKKSLESPSEHYDRETRAEMQAEMETYELAVKYDINYMYYYQNTWKVELLSEIQELKSRLLLTDLDEKKNELQSTINKDVNMLEKNDFKAYIDLEKQNEKTKLEDNQITKEEYEENVYLLDLRGKYEIYKEDAGIYDWKGDVYRDIKAMKENLRTGVNQTTGKLLKLDEIKELEENIKISEYRLENNLPVVDSFTSSRALYDGMAPSFGLLMISILMIIIAGSSISNEISKGTIKFLLFTPNKRWKVLLSKILSAIIILLVLSLILSVLCVLIRRNILQRWRRLICICTKWRSKSIIKFCIYIALYTYIRHRCSNLYDICTYVINHNKKYIIISRCKYDMLYWIWNSNATNKCIYIS